MPSINGDLIPFASGAAHLGVDGNGVGAFDITTIAPYGHIFQLSGIFADPLTGQSGVIRFSQAAGAFQFSVDGGRTFSNFGSGGGGADGSGINAINGDLGPNIDLVGVNGIGITPLLNGTILIDGVGLSGNVVSSIGVIGDVNLTGDVDLAVPSSGFMAIFDTGDASPINFAVDHLALSGFWGFPSQGFNGSLVNELTDANGTSAQGSIQLVGASGIVVDIVGQVATITPGNLIPRCYRENFSNQTSLTVSHNLNLGTPPVVQVYDSNGVLIFPDSVTITNANTVTITFNVQQSGDVIVIGCD